MNRYRKVTRRFLSPLFDSCFVTDCCCFPHQYFYCTFSQWIEYSFDLHRNSIRSLCRFVSFIHWQIESFLLCFYSPCLAGPCPQRIPGLGVDDTPHSRGHLSGTKPMICIVRTLTRLFFMPPSPLFPSLFLFFPLLSRFRDPLFCGNLSHPLVVTVLCGRLNLSPHFFCRITCIFSSPLFLQINLISLVRGPPFFLLLIRGE